MPRVSVVMAVHNAERFLRTAVESVLGQTYAHFELIAVDDASTDHSLAILRSIDDPRLRILQHASNLGAAQARNTAIAAARGEYIAIMDADDVCRPDRLAAQVAFLDANEAVGLVGCATYDNIDVDGTFLYTSHLPEDNESIQATMLRQWCFLHPSIMFRRDLVARAGMYRPEFEVAEDHDFILRLLEYCEARNLDVPLVDYRINPTGLSVSGQRYINDLGGLAMQFARDRRSGRPEDLQQALRLREARASSDLAPAAWRRWKDSFYAANRYYGFGCKALCLGDPAQARLCFKRSIRTNGLFPKSWICLALCLVPPLAKRLRFLFASSMKDQVDLRRRRKRGPVQPHVARGAAGPLAGAPGSSRGPLSGDTDATGLTESAVADLKGKAVRSGFARVCGQAAAFVLRLAALIVLARLLTPRDYGIVGMATVVTGVFGLFKDAGLSMVTIQRLTMTEQELSTLFWINVAVGAVLGTMLAALAPALVAFYHEPRLFWVTVVLAFGFLLNALGVQHSALLQRHMRFAALAAVETGSLLLSIVLAYAMAIRGYGYWALVAMTVAQPCLGSLGFWVVTGWRPGPPARVRGTGSMIRFGGAVTLNSLLQYAAFNADKLLVGRFWGAEVLGIYGRASQLINIPTANLNNALGDVAISALSRVQDRPAQSKRFFLTAYSLVLSLTTPATVACAMHADDIVRVVLGPKWTAAVPLFKLLAPTILTIALINPLTWLLVSSGMIRRSLAITATMAPVVIAAYAAGLPYGAAGVAMSYSAIMMFLAVPIILWSTRGLEVTFRDIASIAIPPMVSAVIAGLVSLEAGRLVGPGASALVRLTLELAVLAAAFFTLQLFVMKQSGLYRLLVLELTGRRRGEPLTDLEVAAGG